MDASEIEAKGRTSNGTFNDTFNHTLGEERHDAVDRECRREIRDSRRR
jgi:hypothetical protein